MDFIIIRFVGIILLLVAHKEHKYGFYKILRIFLFGLSLLGIYYSLILSEASFALIFVIASFLFNPVKPLFLTKRVWFFINKIFALFLFVSLFFI